ncbi:nucleoside transporter [Ancylostoma duodenale]|uniref:Nucleoside transporter n=1 Tax=Ancylostoma duodenale TaxID=51022 RepID=A0A0C2G5Q5_9BILA|nr:nucleoside transporter [Ancylostoma duodenale]
MKEKWDSKSRASKEGGTKKEGEPDGEPPVDKLRFAYFIIMLNGIGVLLPWNMFITIAPNYYVNYWFTINGTRTVYAKDFLRDLGIAAQTPNFLAGLLNLMQIIGGSLMIRIAGTLTVNCINVAVVIILIAAQDPAEEGLNSVFGLTADFPAAYTNALVVGNNICGTFISVLVILTTVGTYQEFYKYYIDKGNRARAAEHASRPSLAQFAETFKGCWQQLVSVFLVFFVTLAVFPAVLAGITPNGKGEPWNSAISRELYPGFTVFLNFNIMAAIGSTTANFVQFGRMNGWKLKLTSSMGGSDNRCPSELARAERAEMRFVTAVIRASCSNNASYKLQDLQET